MKTKLLQVYVPEDTYTEIEDIAKNFSTRSGAVQHILQIGLQKLKGSEKQ